MRADVSKTMIPKIAYRVVCPVIGMENPIRKGSNPVPMS
jgi:hypothetical protein